MFSFSFCALEPPTEPNRLKSSAKCVMTIANRYFVERPTVSIFTTSITRDSSVLHEVYHSQTHVKKLRNFQTFKWNYTEVNKKYAILMGDSLQDFMSHKEQIEYLSLWNARSWYIFFSFTNSEHLLYKFVDVVWDFYIINALVIMPDENDDEMLNIYSWFPYEGELCGTDFQVKLIDQCRHGNFMNNIDLYPNKVPRDLHGCPVRIRVLIWPPFVLPPPDGIIEDDKVLNINEGIEVRLMLAIAKVANFTIQFSSSIVPHDWGLVTFDGNTTGTMKAVKEKKADMGMGSFGPTLERRMYCDYSACHMQESLAWCVPKAQFGPRWKNLLEAFRMSTWLAMILIYLFVSTVICFLSWCPPRDNSSYLHAKNSLIFIYATFLGLSAAETPNKLSGRIAFFIWLIFCLHFVVAYQAKLMGVLLRPTYGKQITSVEEVLKSGMEYALLPTHRRFYQNTDDWRVEKIIREWTDCDDSDACLRRIAYDRDFALCTLKTHAEFESLKYLNSEGKSLLYCIKYATFASEMYMTKGYPFRDRIDKLIYRVRNSGLMFKWEYDIDWIWKMKYRSKMDLHSSHEQVLTLDHLQGAFAVWIIGLSISLLAFIIEFTCYKLWHKHEKTKL